MKDKKKIVLTMVLIVSLISPSYEAAIYDNSSYNSIVGMQVNTNLPPELQQAQKKVIEQLADHYDKVKNYENVDDITGKVRKRDVGTWVYDPKVDKWYFETEKNGRKVGWINPYGNEWYFLDFFTEEMKTGYHIIDGDVYYFEESKIGPVPQGQLYRSRATIDGYGADETGRLVNYTRHKSFLQNY